MDKRCVAFYDSGFGGLTLLERTRNSFPSEDYVYFADLKNMPYGEKSQGELENIFYAALKKIASFSPKLIVVACNTMSCSMKDRAKNFPVKIVWVVPYLGRKGERTILLSTLSTSRSEYVARLVGEKTTFFPLRFLAEAIDKWSEGGEKPNVEKWLDGVDRSFDVVSLGCTHFSRLADDFQKAFPRSVIKSGEEAAFGEISNFLTTFDTKGERGDLVVIKSS